MQELKIEYIDIGELKTYANNAKIHTSAQVEQIKRSIQEFGFNDPIAVWHDNEIIEGHGRLIAANELGIDRVPIIRLDELTDEQRKAYMLVHNKLTMNTDFDIDILNLELNEIANIDMEWFGFNIDDDEDIEIIQKPVQGEVKFTEVLGEDHNYIVLYFDNEVDWLQLQSIIDVSGKMNLSTRRDGRVGKNMKRISTGRVFKGVDVLEAMREHFENLH